ncbi:MAG: hypothetical protein CM1200mP31_5590 [Candidatus Neomarinimicrobiota bacterium]|nr:MAG: hypothetical protein CM1200mP31_5590 [Candidatus Neomarinimicrobiota bacterium]
MISSKGTAIAQALETSVSSFSEKISKKKWYFFSLMERTIAMIRLI